MEQQIAANALPITEQEMPAIDIDAALADVEDRCCQYYDDAYFKAATKADDPGSKALCQSLAILCSFYPQYGNPAEPYRASIIDGNRRTAIPDDLTDADIQTVETLLSLAKDPALRARLADVLWLRKKSAHDVARVAVDDYLAAARSLLKPKGWIHSVELFQRALQLGMKLGRKKEAYQLAQKAVRETVDHSLAQTEPFFASYFLPLIRSFQIGEPRKMADIAKSQAELALTANDQRRQRIYLLLEADFCRLANDSVRETATRLLAAETYVKEAANNVERTPPSYFAASDCLAKAIEALRQAHAPPERIRALKQQLKEYQRNSMGEMKTLSIPVDTREAVAAATKYVTNQDLRRAMALLSLGIDIVHVDTLRSEVLEAINQAPFTHIMGESMVDSEGRPVGHKQPLIGLAGEEAEKELQKRMFEHAANFDWKWRVRMFIEPARLQIWRQHQPTMRDFEYLVAHNPFIPPGHEGLFLQGIYYGLAGDLMIASHLLTPQIENSIRYVVEQNGGDITNINSDLTQPVKTLGALFEIPETKRIFGNDLCFEMRGLLIEKHGYSFRNEVAHGFLTDAGCYTEAAMNVWWLVLKLCHSTMILPDDLS
jgi:hypothetical protein